MSTHSSATAREEIPHEIETNRTTINKAVRRRAESVINDRSIDAGSRTLIRYALEINDPLLTELVRRVDAGESIVDANFSEMRVSSFEDDLSEAKIEALTELICRAGDEPDIKSAALLVLMATLESAAHPKVLANMAKHLAFTHCGELNLCGIVDAQVAVIEAEVIADALAA
ncbi:MAG TPA: hypothetical protein VGN10_03120 [Pyrinomonadaceae bacterium]|jgi:hypothetical protein